MTLGMMAGMSLDRVTVSLPAGVREVGQRVAESDGVPFSTVVAEALSRYVRGRLVDEWLREHQQEFGAFDEIELRMVASEAGVPYLPPSRDREFS